MKTAVYLLAFSLTAMPAVRAATRVLATVVDPKTGSAIVGLQASDFTVLDDRTPRRVEGAEFTTDTLDIMLLLDASLVGEMVLPVAQSFVAQLQPKEQMAVVAYDSSAELIQEFTSSRDMILRAISKVKFGNEPRVLDGLYAVLDGGFQSSPFRRVVILLTSGFEGYSRTSERDVIRLARRNQVSIFPAYVTGNARSLFENLARQTGGASFNLREMTRAGVPKAGERVFDAVRGHYLLTLEGNLRLGEKLKVEVKNAPKAQVSAMPLD